MDPLTIGAGALGALENITGGAAAPSSAFLDSKASANQSFMHGAVNFGSNNQQLPTWVLVGVLALGGWYVYKKTK
ncbi:hypothetical protein [Vibrio hepatarius]|uniref:hypothetical protein n=1 Tax=Vibrio hepatarius TaxID=171383 RepID=UPI00148C798E|nr:hypothetical protein [Vibrio hepatarius]NOI13804.1 hypothetical protein [Vibrio hepatarius]